MTQSDPLPADLAAAHAMILAERTARRAAEARAEGRHNWTFAGSDRGGERAAAMYTLIETAKLNGVDPQAWLADVLARLPDHAARQLDDLLPWSWTPAWPSLAAGAPQPPTPSPDAYVIPGHFPSLSQPTFSDTSEPRPFLGNYIRVGPTAMDTQRFLACPATLT